MPHQDRKAPGRAKRRLLIVLVGPTSSGKSELAFKSAEILNGEIVNCDSVQMYRLIEIGSAKPAPQQRRQIPHHLYDLVDPDQYFSAGRYMEEARKVCREIADRARIPFVVGGTGLYLRALLEGMFKGPGRSQDIRERLEKIGRRKGFDFLYRFLLKKDPQAAGRIQPGDRVRIIRSLEVYLLTGRPISQLQQQREPLANFSILKIGLDLPRPDLYDRIDRRVSEMFSRGLLKEVQELLDKDYSPDCKGFEALGYRHAFAALRGELSQEEAIKRTQIDTRRYAKRQLTWFRREEGVHWIPGPGEDFSALQQLLKLVGERRLGDSDL
ncbi:MAG: tRNA (adenosine(37)-N6)-dimethylallyltransferase MiaA [Acidobacteria bacterium]|nr:tRNA (adenosine(37)-N6)-dimethylallyltransferase MiaA [Acidobacteriota bacterium]